MTELMIVIAVIAILAVILIVFFAHERDNASVVSCETNERTIAEALDAYSIDHGGRFPTTSGPVNAAMFGGPNNPYFTRNNLIDPASGLPYLYTDGPGSCQSPDAEYQIIDQGGHSSDSLLALLSADSQEDSVAFCSTSGLYASSGSGAGAASMAKPH